jgi:hypothetical protein
MRKVVAVLTTAALVVLGLMFSVVIFTVIAVAGLTAWGYLWWKTRGLRRQLREQMSTQTMGGMVNEAEAHKGEIIEGVVIRKTVTIEEVKR